MDQNNFCIIMAGGVGSRFWPLSRQSKPKQFLDILNVGRTLLQMTYDRICQFIATDNIYIVTNQQYEDMVAEQLPELPKDNIMGEPLRCNTAPCIAYASFKIQNINPEANIIVAPSDHLILREQDFISIARESLTFVNNHDALVTLGIKPSHPETGYGYIQIYDEGSKSDHFKQVKTFTEKPNYDMAKLFYESGDFYWNAGIFIWSVSSIMAALSKNVPDIYMRFKEGEGVYNTAKEKAFIEKTYQECEAISIDYGVMEKAENVYMYPSNFGWSDLGTWSALYHHRQKDHYGNAGTGDHVMTYDTEDCVIQLPQDKLAVIQGLKDYIVVENDNILLICNKNEEQKIKAFLEEVKDKKGEHYL